MRYKAGILVLLAVLGAPIFAQTATVDIEAEIEEGQRNFEEWMAATKVFIGSTTFDENDIRSFIELWPEFEAIGEEADDEDDEEMLDYKTIINDPLYEEFVDAHGLSAETWFKKSIRIMTLVMGDQMAPHLVAAEAQIPYQLQMIEKQKAQLGAEAYQTMKSSIEASITMMKRQREAWGGMPEPTASERALLDTYRDDLAMLLMGDDEEEEWEEEEWAEEEYEEQ